MGVLIGAVIVSFVTSACFFPSLIKFSKKKISVAPGYRRIHKHATPSVGGIAIFLGFLTSCVVWPQLTDWPNLKFILGILFITFLLGLWDDLAQIRPLKKLAGQAITGSLIFFMIDIRLTSSYGLSGDFELPYLASYFATVFVIIIITNSFNLIDGIDGLAGTFSVLSLTFFGTWFYLIKDNHFSLLSFALVGALLAFLIVNWEPSKIFMGDTGTIFIGMVLSMLTIHFINRNDALAPGSAVKFHATLATAIAIIIIPIVDTARIIIVRLLKGTSPLVADNRHIHHCLVRLGLRHYQAVLLLAGVQLLYLLAALYFRECSDLYLVPAIIAFSVVLCLILDFFTSRRSGRHEV